MEGCVDRSVPPEHDTRLCILELHSNKKTLGYVTPAESV